MSVVRCSETTGHSTRDGCGERVMGEWKQQRIVLLLWNSRQF